VITKALMTLVHGVETKFDGEMVAMTRVPWATIESVGDQSEYDLFESFYVTSSDNIHFVCYKAVMVLSYPCCRSSNPAVTCLNIA
jgi:hypothetical protein